MSLREKYIPHEYQIKAEHHLYEYTGAGLFMEMGLGKTVVTLTALKQMLERGEIKRILIVAPKRVADITWPEEIEKWEHLQGLTYSKVLGTEAQRHKALLRKTQIYLINRENIPWLVANYGLSWPFDCMVIDELSSFKSAKSIRFKSIRMILPKTNRIIGLTGTPMPNGLVDLWPQLYILDQGQRLGKTLGEYRNKYFIPDKVNGHIVYSYKIKKADDLLGDIYALEIFDKIKDICMSMKARDYLNLPPKFDNVVKVALDDKVKKAYDEFEEEQFLRIADKELTAANAAVLTGKLLQFASGAVYDEQKNWVHTHDAKIEALEGIIEEAQGAPVLVFYNYKHSLERMKKKIKGLRELKTPQDFKDWNNGLIPVAAAHPASMGHGLNLQAGGNIVVWFDLIWSLELYMQANARLDRQGQTRSVVIHHLVAKGTMDEDVMEALKRKDRGQNTLMQAVKARVDKYLKHLL